MGVANNARGWDVFKRRDLKHLPTPHTLLMATLQTLLPKRRYIHYSVTNSVFQQYNVVEILQQRGYLVAMTGDGVNDAPSLKKADTGIAVEGASDAARSAADIVFLAPGLGAIIDALKTSRQIFHRMYAYVVYRIALSIHLEIFLGLWIAILNRSLNIELVVFIAIFADVATLAIAYDNAPFSRTPVKWNLP